MLVLALSGKIPSGTGLPIGDKMPYMSDTALARLEDRAMSSREEEAADDLRYGVEALGAATLFGYLRGAVEKQEKTFTVPNTQLDIEMLVGLGLVGASFFEMFGGFEKDAQSCGWGLLSHYMGQVARSYGKSGTISYVAGDGGYEIVGAPQGMDDLLSTI